MRPVVVHQRGHTCLITDADSGKFMVFVDEEDLNQTLSDYNAEVVEYCDEEEDVCSVTAAALRLD